MAVPCQLIHAIPGRLRVRLEATNGQFERLIPALQRVGQGQDGVEAVHFNAAARSVVLTYDPQRLSPHQVLSWMRRVSHNGETSLTDAAASTADSASTNGRTLVTKSQQQDDIRVRATVCHAMAGRVRIRVEIDPEHCEFLSEIAEALRRRRKLCSVRLNAACRSLVCRFRPDECTPRELVTWVESMSLDELCRVRQSLAAGENGAARAAAEEGHRWLPLSLSTLAAAASLVAGPQLTFALVLGAAIPMFSRAVDVLRGRRLNVDVLDAAATAVLMLRRQNRAAAAMLWLVSLGDFIRDTTMQQSQRVIRNLFDEERQNAWLVRDGKKHQIKVSEIREGNELVVYSGEIIPADGTVTAGRATVDQSFLTGESVPADRSPGDRVFAGAVLCDGKLYLRAEQTGADTMAAKIIRLVQEAPIRETRIQNYASHFADRMVPWSFVGAAASFAITRNANAAAGILIADYGTGIRVAAPTTVLSSMAKAARLGILMKGGGRFLELLTQVDTIVFDKTGTLTRGAPALIDVVPYGVSRDRLLAVAAAAEQRLNHPIALAIERAARQSGLSIPERSASHYSIGMGVEAEVEGRLVHVGCHRYMTLHGIDIAKAESELRTIQARAAIPTFVSIDRRVVGLLAFEDPLHDEAASVVRALHGQHGIREVVMLTGDIPAVAQCVASRLGIARFVAEAMPEEKADFVRTLQRQGRVVAVVGDGVNDSPALAQADVGIAVQGGADVACETAHVVLLERNLWKIPQAFDIAHESLRLIGQNWHLNFYPNTAVIALAVCGLIGPVGATLISNGSAVLATLNGLRPLARNGAIIAGPALLSSAERASR